MLRLKVHVVHFVRGIGPSTGFALQQEGRMSAQRTPAGADESLWSSRCAHNKSISCHILNHDGTRSNKRLSAEGNWD